MSGVRGGWRRLARLRRRSRAPGPGPQAPLLAAAIVVLATSTARADDGADAPYRDADEAALELAYDTLTARRPPHYLRALLEETVIMAGSAGWYWIDRDRQVADWDFPSWQQRFNGDAWRFDNNPFPINFAWHPFNGGAFHVVARANELSLPASIGYGLATSMAWEWLLEFREKVSVNDVISTTIAGTALGEFVHWFGRYVESAPAPRWWHPYVAWVPNAPRALHHALDGKPAVRAGTAPDALGLSSDLWHRFLTATSVSRAVMSGDAADGAGADAPDALTLGELRLTGELAALPGYLTARHLRRGFAEANVTALTVRLALGPDAIALDWHSDAIIAGWHTQHVPDGGVGSATTVGVAIGYRYRRELFGGWRERQGLTHLPGLALDHHVLAPGVVVRARARAHVDFAGLHAGAHPRWEADHPDEVEKTILDRHGYYYAWGASGRVELEARLAGPRLDLGGVVQYGRYASQEGLDRNQESLTFDVEAEDTILEWESWLRWRPTRGPLYVEGRVSHQDRDGSVGDASSSQALRRYVVELGAAL